MFRVESALCFLTVCPLVLLAGACASDSRSPSISETGLPNEQGSMKGSSGGGSESPNDSSGGGAAGDGIEIGGDNPVPLDPNAGRGGESGGSGKGAGNEPPPETIAFVEDGGLDCAIGALPASVAALETLPNPFVKLDGTTVASRADWRCRRKELRAMAERYVYGAKPPKPDVVSGEVTADQIDVEVAHQGNGVRFSAVVVPPETGSPPYPVVFSLVGADRNTFLDEGVAVVSVNLDAIGQEGPAGSGSATNRQNKTGAFYDLYGASNPAGLLAAWAWSVSRYIDVIEASNGSLLRKDAFAVMGCSRAGKAALAIGALDERIALTVPFESGPGGVPLLRAIAEGEEQPSPSLTLAYDEQAWLGDAFASFLGSVDTLPIDTHEIIGMIAPRGLLVLDNPLIAVLNARGGHAAALAGFEVYEALGAEANFAYFSNTSLGSHCMIRPEYQEPLRQAIRRHLFDDATAAAGGVQPDASAAATPEEWINWQTPALR